MTERLRKFFRIRGKTAFALDEIVAPVVLVQDLTVGPYQAGVTPAAGTLRVDPAGTLWAIAVVLNDKIGSLTPVLDDQFNDRSFSFLWAEIQNLNLVPVDVSDVVLRLAKRSDVLGAGVPSNSAKMFQIQNGDGTQTVPVEIFSFNDVDVSGSIIWRGPLGDNQNTLGSRRRFEDIQPNVTIGPNEALVFSTTQFGTGNLQVSLRGFYQEQPA